MFFGSKAIVFSKLRTSNIQWRTLSSLLGGGAHRPHESRGKLRRSLLGTAPYKFRCLLNYGGRVTALLPSRVSATGNIKLFVHQCDMFSCLA